MESDWLRNLSDSPTILLSRTSTQSCNASPRRSFNQIIQPFKPSMSSQSRIVSQRSPPGTAITLNPSRKRARDESPEVTLETDFSFQSIGTKLNGELPYGEKSTTFRLKTGGSPPGQSTREVRLGDRFKSESAFGIEVQGSLTSPQQDSALRRRRKFQRRNMSSGYDAKGICSKILNSPVSGVSEPTVDHFTHLLGVGWARISDDKDVQAAARGWSRYIENHYPLSMVRIVLRSKGLEANLAETGNGYFLFKDDLSEGQLVGSDWETCLANLQRRPIAFQGSETLKAARTTTYQSTSSNTRCRIDSNLGSFQIETSWLCREDDEMIVS